MRDVSQTLPFDVPVVRQVSLTRLVGELARAIAEVGKVVVEGEVHRPTTSGANRTYFVLRDRGVQLSVAVPASRQRSCRVREGERVAVTGVIEMQPDRGQMQLIAQEVQPVGAGAIAAMIAESRERLRRDGLLDRERRRVPLLPGVIGVVCGTEAAVQKDIESVVAARFPGYPLRFCHVSLTGPGAVDSIVTGMALLAGEVGVDVIVLARGGGDSTQLLPFSDEALCRAVAACPLPVVSAIGHDGDRPLCDEVADLRAGTPSIAAALVVPDRRALLANLDALSARADIAAQRAVERGATRMESISWRTALDRRIDRSTERLTRVDWSRAVARLGERSTHRLASVDWNRGIDVRVRQASSQLGSVFARVEALSPARVLERGYAIVRTAEGSVVRDAASITAGAAVHIAVASGAFDATVTDVFGARARDVVDTDDVRRVKGNKP